MKVAKTVVKRYEVDLVNEPKSASNIARAINDLAKAGVDMENAEFEDGDRKTFTVIVTKRTYYDDSTLKRMENGAI